MERHVIHTLVFFFKQKIIDHDIHKLLVYAIQMNIIIQMNFSTRTKGSGKDDKMRRQRFETCKKRTETYSNIKYNFGGSFSCNLFENYSFRHKSSKNYSFRDEQIIKIKRGTLNEFNSSCSSSGEMQQNSLVNNF